MIVSTKELQLKELKSRLVRLKAQKKVIVFTNGCFDVLHVGHLRYLSTAKRLGDFLVVGINSDRAVRMIKGDKRPLISEEERAELVSAFSCVDAVVIFDEPDANKIILELKPDIHAKGTDYTKENVPERNAVLSYGGKIAIVGDSKAHSTKDIIKRVINAKQC